MGTYILFLFGKFQDHEDIEYFCMEVLGESELFTSLKYVIDNLNNIIIIFDSEYEKQKLTTELDSLLDNDNVMFYFLFPKESILSSHIPESMRNLIFKPSSDILNSAPKTEEDGEIILNNILDRMNEDKLILDDILDKIERFGIDNLTPLEKKFLDNFEK
jgi:hypothetical protein